MEALLTKLFITHGAVQATLVLALTICFGILLGRIKIMSVSFGIGGILFSGIILGHFGMSLDPRVLVFAREFGLILFVYAIGISVGPTFLESLRDQGLKLNLMSMYIVFPPEEPPEEPPSPEPPSPEPPHPVIIVAPIAAHSPRAASFFRFFFIIFTPSFIMIN